ncbi:methylated-DNA--[protein]-cysteine S-methyltransferase [Neptunomonas marina]|uniref:methylated-DNA--[protein]-cysteine S-methyltransferase n=2 Tax=Neptunomonas marina TaxID=1815562 RepID=A0A437Q752_9GAMM|nr:methylated-DNA--[protein]-cysteine S-methyltransferase [Neptunomonas marina]
MTLPPDRVMKEAISSKDPSRDGQFFYGMVGTGIFCKPSCTSNQIDLEKLEFFRTIKDATQAGYQPCKACLLNPDWAGSISLIKIARYIEDHADEKLTLSSLSGMAGVSPSRLQRAFKKAFGVSPKSYQDAIRIQMFKYFLRKKSGSITEAIYDSGFGSISRVYGEESRSLGMQPKSYKAGGAGEVIFYACRDTTYGLVLMAATGKGVCFLQFGQQKQSLLTALSTEFPKAELICSPAQEAPELDNWIDAVNLHLSNGAPKPDLPLDMQGTAFQIKVWKFLLSIKEGDTLSYGEVANQIGRPTAFRSVATACAKNRIAVLIPCHRVLRGDGSLGGYRWGSERKQALLDMEKQRQRD